jgi:hypothetical protein
VRGSLPWPAGSGAYRNVKRPFEPVGGEERIVVAAFHGRERHAVAARQRDAALGEGTQPQFRALQVDQHADRPAEAFLQRADALVHRAMVVVAAMAEVEAKGVRPGLDEGTQAALVRTRGPDSREDLGSLV